MDRNETGFLGRVALRGRSLRGNVDRNLAGDAPVAQDAGRSLRGNVDRNKRPSAVKVS